MLTREWLPLDQVVREIGRSERTVQRLATAGELRFRQREGTREREYHAGDVSRIKEEGTKTHREEPAPANALAFPPALRIPRWLPAAAPAEPKLWLTLEEAAAFSGLGVRLLKRLCRERKLTALKERGEGWKVRRVSLEDFAG